MGQVTVIDHPLVQHKLTIMRDKNTSSGKFRRLLSEVSQLLAYEVTRDMPAELGFVHPVTGEELAFEAALPPDMAKLVDALRR